jgi:ABC-type Fe3+/spermidine/putrescine transport system ATPase subunit
MRAQNKTMRAKKLRTQAQKEIMDVQKETMRGFVLRTHAKKEI